MDDLRKLLKYFRPYKWSLAIGIACILAGVVFNVTIPQIVGNAIDANWHQVTWSKLNIAALKILGASVMSGIFLFLQRRIIIGVSRHIEYDLRNDFYAHLVDQPLSYSMCRETPIMMRRCRNRKMPLMTLAPRIFSAAMLSFDQVTWCQLASMALPTI